MSQVRLRWLPTIIRDLNIRKVNRSNVKKYAYSYTIEDIRGPAQKSNMEKNLAFFKCKVRFLRKVLFHPQLIRKHFLRDTKGEKDQIELASIPHGTAVLLREKRKI
jgi:hypothetical protein